MWIDHAYRQSKLSLHDVDSQYEIGIIRYHDRGFIRLPEAIYQEICGEINVRSLLFGDQHLNRTGTGWRWIYQRQSRSLGQECPVMN